MKNPLMAPFVGLGFLAVAAGCSVTLPYGAGLCGAIDEAFGEAETAIAGPAVRRQWEELSSVMIGGALRAKPMDHGARGGCMTLPKIR